MASLTDRVDRILRQHEDVPLLSTTPTEVAIGELIKRSEGLAKAIRELAAELEVPAKGREVRMSETQGNEQIGQRDERDQQPEEPRLGEEAPVGSGGTPHPGASDSSQSGRPEDAAEEGRPDQETLQEETPGTGHQ
jgi:hypothetical protein